MHSLFVSHRAFNELLDEKSTSGFHRILNDERYLSIKPVDDSLLQSLCDEKSREFTLAQSKDLNIDLTSDNTLASSLSKDKKITSGLSSSMFVIDNIDREITAFAAQRHHTYCIPDNDVKITDFPKDYEETLADGEAGGWSEVLKYIKELPISALVFNDHYLNKNLINTSRNVRDILLFLFKGKQYKKPIQILFILGVEDSTNDNSDIDKVQEIYNEIIEPVMKETSIKINPEFIFCDNKNIHDWPLYKHTHNRYIITNYSFVTVPHTLNAFSKDGKSTEIQTFKCESGMRTRSAHHKYRKTIVGDINDGIRKLDKCPYHCFRMNTGDGYSEMTPKRIDVDKISNRLISEIQEGDMCYTLKIPESKDWIRGKASELVTYVPRNQSICCCTKTEKEMLELASRIADVFKSIKSDKLATAEDKPFYWIKMCAPSRKGPIDYVKEDGVNLKKQRQYTNNYFCDEDYAIQIANSICDILQIPHINKHC